MNRLAFFTCASQKGCGDFEARLNLQRISYVPNVAPHVDRNNRQAGHGGDLLFVGSLNYKPNLDGLRWFAQEIWPRLSELLPRMRVIVAGAEPASEVRAICRRSGFRLVANPDDIRPLYRRAAAAIVPLRFGSGSRIKILEAGALGVPVISTRKGAEGLELDESTDAFISDESADQFVASCVECLSDKVEARARASALKRRVEDRHLRSSVVDRLKQYLLSVKAGSSHE